MLAVALVLWPVFARAGTARLGARAGGAPLAAYVDALHGLSTGLLPALPSAEAPDPAAFPSRVSAPDTALLARDLPADPAAGLAALVDPESLPQLAAAATMERILEDPAAGAALIVRLQEMLGGEGFPREAARAILRVAGRVEAARTREAGRSALDRAQRALAGIRSGRAEESLDELFANAQLPLRLDAGVPVAAGLGSAQGAHPNELLRLRQAERDHARFTSLVEDAELPAAQQRALLRAAEEDIFTGLYSRDTLERHARSGELTRDGREVLLLDIDNFGVFNAVLGPRRTDAVIARFSNRLYALVRAMNEGHRTAGAIYRLGGEEIVILAARGSGRELAQEIRRHVESELPKILLAEGFLSADELRRIEEAAARRAGGRAVPVGTVSIGVTHLPRLAPATPEQGRRVLSLALARADKALQAAKAAGRNRIAAFDGLAMEELPKGADSAARDVARFERKEFSSRSGAEPAVARLVSALDALAERARSLAEWVGDVAEGARAFALRLIGADNKAPSLLSRKGLLIEAGRAYSDFDTFAVLEIAGFKDVNDGADHAAGDAVLTAYGERLGAIAREEKLDVLIARRLGKEFVAVGSAGGVARLLERAAAISLADALPDAVTRERVQAHMDARYAREGRRRARPAGSIRGFSRPWRALRPEAPGDPVAALEADVDLLRSALAERTAAEERLPAAAEHSSPRERIDAIARAENFDPDQLLDELERDPEIGAIFSKDVGLREKYTLREHTRMVFRQFERYLKGRVPAARLGAFRLFLALHDVGKAKAVALGDKSRQHEFNRPMLEAFLVRLGYPAEDIRWMGALVDADYLGALLNPYTKQPLSAEQSIEKISAAAREAGLPEREFFALLLAFYMADASSYTFDAGGTYPYKNDGSEPPSLDYHFRFDRAGRAMEFAPDTARRLAAVLARFSA